MALWRNALLFTLFLFTLNAYTLGTDVTSSGHEALPTSENNRVRRKIRCEPERYFHNKLCCQKCPAGTCVLQHCQTHGGKSICASCQSGVEFTAAANGLERCLTCKRCRGDKETVHICNSTLDAVCQCKSGRFCTPNGPCEYCDKCTEGCPEGQVIVQHCNATSDTVCGKETVMTPDCNATSDAGCGKETVITPDCNATLDTGCGKETVITPDCNATSDTVCGKETTQKGGSFEGMYLIILIPLMLLIILSLGLKCKTQPRKDTSFGHVNQSQEMGSTEVSVQNFRTPLLTDAPLAVEESAPLVATTRTSMPRPPTTQTSQYIPVGPCDVSPVNRPTEGAVHLPATNVEEGSRRLLENQEEPAGTTVLHYHNELPNGKFAEQSTNGNVYTDFGISQKDTPTIFNIFINEVPLRDWKMFMRTMLLNNNEIDAAVLDNPNNVNEQHYAMLVKWKNKFGNDATVDKLLLGLSEMKLKACYENIENELMQIDICIGNNSNLNFNMR